MTMTPQQFASWLEDMKDRGIARSDAACGRLLGFSPNSIAKIKRKGTDQRTALACAALLNGLKPYPTLSVNARLDRDIVDVFKHDGGDDWEARVNDALRAALIKHKAPPLPITLDRGLRR